MQQKGHTFTHCNQLKYNLESTQHLYKTLAYLAVVKEKLQTNVTFC